jgi:hypothetical protein
MVCARRQRLPLEAIRSCGEGFGEGGFEVAAVRRASSSSHSALRSPTFASVQQCAEDPLAVRLLKRV